MSVFYFDDFALFRPWSVRTYNMVRRIGRQLTTAEQVVDLADDIVLGLYRNVGRRCAVELYRGAGLGVRVIYDRLDGAMALEDIVTLCNQFDIMFHEPID